jgi:prepilin-type processing-associated H-X9-DG protein
MLVVIAILAILCALIIPAVQHSREAARRVRCAANLKQVGLAVQSYHSSHGVLPHAWGWPNHSSGSIVLHKQFSIFTQLLPYFDETILYASINFDAGIDDFYLFDSGPEFRRMGANRTVIAAGIDVLICPSDAAGHEDASGGTNYRVNLGSNRWYYSKDGPMMARFQSTSLAHTRDGASNTVAFSEKLRSERDERFEPRTDMVVGGLGLPYSAEQSRARCAEGPDSPLKFFEVAGLTWFVGTLSQTCYNHVSEPNGTVPDCISITNPINGLSSARSDHPGGVYVLMLDGSARFVQETISRETWRAMGTRAGGELVHSFAD